MRTVLANLSGLRSGAAIVKIARLARVAVVGVASLVASGCYQYSAVPTTQPLVEQQAEFRITDAGRVQLGNQLGPGVVKLEGRVVRQDDSGWTVKVYRIINVRNEATTWTGEEVELPSTAVDMVQLRSFDRQRSLVAAAAFAGGVTFFVLTRSILGGGTATDIGEGGGPPATAIRY